MHDLNKELIEQLLQRIDLLEKEMKKHKKSKMADKDYDKDGKIETSEEEYLGSKDRAIKMAMGKKIEEALYRVGGNSNYNNPSIHSLAANATKTDLVNSVVNLLGETKNMNHKAFKDQGTRIQISENIIFGGFPRVKLNEEENIGATVSFTDTDDPKKQINVATKTDAEEDLYVPGHMGLRYPSKEYKNVALTARAAEEELSALNRAHAEEKQAQYRAHMGYAGGKPVTGKKGMERSQSFVYQSQPEMQSKLISAQEKAKAARAAQESHPHHGHFMKAAETHYKLVRGPVGNVD